MHTDDSLHVNAQLLGHIGLEQTLFALTLPCMHTLQVFGKSHDSQYATQTGLQVYPDSVYPVLQALHVSGAAHDLQFIVQFGVQVLPLII